MVLPKRPRFEVHPPATLPGGPSQPHSPLGADELAAVREFVARVGGLTSAKNALALLAAISAQGTKRAA